MTAKQDSADTDTDRPEDDGQSDDDMDGLDEAEDGADHDGPGGVAGREAELVHHLDGGELIIYIVGRSATSGECFENSHDNNVKYQSKKQVEEEG